MNCSGIIKIIISFTWGMKWPWSVVSLKALCRTLVGTGALILKASIKTASV